MEVPVCQKRQPPSPTGCSSPAKKCTYECRGITALPRELVVKILANLDGRDLMVCKRVTREWQEIIDSTPMLPRAFYRRLHPLAPAPGSLATVKDYHCSIRHWLERFSEQGRKLVVELDELALAGARFFPERLFFSLAQVLAEAPVLVCQRACTIKNASWIHKSNFSPNGRYVVTASDDKTAKVCELIDGQWQEITTLTHPDRVLNVLFSPTGDYCLTLCINRTIHIWEIGGMAGPWQSRVIFPHYWLLHPPCFSADGNYLVTGSTEHTIQILQLANGQWQQQTTLPDSDDEALFHPREHLLATAHDRGSVYIWRLVDKQWKNETVLKHPGYVAHICFSPDGNHLLITTRKSHSMPPIVTVVYIYNSADRAWGQEAALPIFQAVTRVRFSHKGDKLAIMAYRWVVATWQFSDNLWQQVMLPQVGDFMDVCFSPDDDCLLTTDKNNTAILWRQVGRQWQQETSLQFEGRYADLVFDGCFSPYGHHLVTMPDNADARIWGMVNGQWQEKSYPPLGRVREGSFSPDGLYFLARSRNDNTVVIWTFQQGCSQQRA